MDVKTEKVRHWRTAFRTCAIAIGLVTLSTISMTAFAEVSPFDFPESDIQSSPSESKKLKLPDGESIVDFDIAPTRPEAAIIVKGTNGKHEPESLLG
jgi:hypothetical protein